MAAAVARAWEDPEPRAAARAARLLDLDTVTGQTQLGLGVVGLFVPGGLAVQAGLLLTSLGLTAAGNIWDAGPAGQQGLVGRAARLSLGVPAVVTVDDAGCLDPALAMALVWGLAGRADGQVLVVVAAAPGSNLAHTLARDPGPDLADG